VDATQIGGWPTQSCDIWTNCELQFHKTEYSGLKAGPPLLDTNIVALPCRRESLVEGVQRVVPSEQEIQLVLVLKVRNLGIHLVKFLDPELHTGTLDWFLVSALLHHIDKDSASGSGDSSRGAASTSSGGSQLVEKLRIHLHADIRVLACDHTFLENLDRFIVRNIGSVDLGHGLEGSGNVECAALAFLRHGRG